MKHSRWILYIPALLVVGLFCLELLAQGSDPLLGTWVLNLSKSKFMSGPPPKSDTRSFAQDGDVLKFTRHAIDANGKPVLFEYAAKFDGKDYPTTGSADTDTISMRRIDRVTSESIQKKAGKVVYVNIRVISANGKVWTLTAVSTNAKGETVADYLVFDKK